MQDIVLASASPRRIEMMKNAGYAPIICPAHITETVPENAGMEETVTAIALQKASAVEAAHPEFRSKILIAADTIVFHDRVIGKPKDRADAFRILDELRGKTHFVATGVAILCPARAYRHVFSTVSEVLFANYSDADIHAYIDTPEPYDKAGGYAIQGAWGRHVLRYTGSLNNIIGFPWETIEPILAALLREPAR